MEVDGGVASAARRRGAPLALVVAPRAAERAHGTERSRPPQCREGGGWRGVLRPTGTDDVQCRATRRPDGAGAAGGGSHGRLRGCPGAPRLLTDIGGWRRHGRRYGRLSRRCCT